MREPVTETREDIPARAPGLSYRARRRWALVILLLGMPLYIVAVVTVLNWLDRPPIWLELLVYVALGVLWALPFKFIFRGVGQADPGADPGSDPGSDLGGEGDRRG